jgi:hypothetical protein
MREENKKTRMAGSTRLACRQCRQEKDHHVRCPFATGFIRVFLAL